MNEICQKGLNHMKELKIMEATAYTSPNPLTLICSLNEDGTTNLAHFCFVSYLSFNPPMIGLPQESSPTPASVCGRLVKSSLRSPVKVWLAR